jgi:hypothetical protein
MKTKPGRQHTQAGTTIPLTTPWEQQETNSTTILHTLHIQMHAYQDPQERRSAGAQERRSAGAQERRSVGAQMCRCADVQMCRCADVQMCRCADVQNCTRLLQFAAVCRRLCHPVPDCSRLPQIAAGRSRLRCLRPRTNCILLCL